MRSIGHDLRYALRVFRSHPGVTLVAVLSLALGIGANSTIFSLVDGMFLRPLSVRDPGGLLWVSSQTVEGRQSGIGWLDYLDLKESGGALADVAAQSRRGALLNTGGEAELGLLTVVSDNYFSLLGVEAARGRLFRADLDTALSNEPAVAISHSLWQRRFGADPSLVGRTIQMNNRAFTVVGVLPPEFRGLVRFVRNDVWVPVSTWKAMGSQREFESRGANQFELLARLRAGATIEQAQAQLDAISRRIQQDYAEAHRGRKLTVASEEMRQSERGVKPSLFLLSPVGLLVLLAAVPVPRAQVAATCDEMIERIGGLAGVKQAAYCRRLPLSGSGGGATQDVIIPGRLAAAGRLMSGLLYGVSPYDPATLALSVAAVLMVALAASFYPAWRATRVDPATVLRSE